MIYLDNAATTYPKPEAVYESVTRFLKEAGGNPGRGGHHFSMAAGQIVEDTRRTVADLFGIADSRRIIFTYNCTDSVNMVLRGLLKAGDHVISTNLDHNAVARPLDRLRRELPCEVTRIPFGKDGSIDPSDVKTAIRNTTKLVVLNHGSNVLGCVQPLQEFSQIGIPVLLDAAQTAGRIPIHAGDMPVFIACSAHKNLYGLPGLGILTVPQNASLESSRQGGTGTISESLEHPEELPMRLEAGTPNTPAIASLKAGIEYIKKEGMNRIHTHELELADKLLKFLRNDPRFICYSSDSSERLAVVAFNFKNVPTEEASTILDQTFGIAVRGGLHCAAVLHAQLGTIPGGCIRVSPGFMNTANELDTLIAALKNIAEKY